MDICEWCGEEFDFDEAETIFVTETRLLSYLNVKKCLCGKCAVEAIEDQVDGVYYETCEECGKEFDLITEESDFNSHFPWYNGAGLRDHWDNKILCCDCALDLVEKERLEFEED